MIKTIYFGEYTAAEAEEMGIECFALEGKLYEFKMEVSIEDRFLRIYDSCNRMLPFDFTHYAGLKRAVELAQGLDLVQATIEAYTEVLHDGKSAVGIPD